MGVALDHDGPPPIAMPTGDYAVSDATRRDVDLAAMTLAREAYRRARALLAANRELPRRPRRDGARARDADPRGARRDLRPPHPPGPGRAQGLRPPRWSPCPASATPTRSTFVDTPARLSRAHRREPHVDGPKSAQAWLRVFGPSTRVCGETGRDGGGTEVVVDAGGAEPEGRDLSVPVLWEAPGVDVGARADRAGGRPLEAAPRAHGVRAEGAGRRDGCRRGTSGWRRRGGRGRRSASACAGLFAGKGADT